MKHLEIVVCCYNEEECVRPLQVEIEKAMSERPDVSYSILYVNDGSKDNTLAEIQKLESELGKDKIRYISFARNFGKESAIYAGFEHAKGDYIALMDADLQHPPKLLLEMITGLEEGYDCVGARRVDRKGEPPVRSFFSNIFYKFVNKYTAMRLVPGGSDYRMMTKQMVDAIMELSERERFTKGIMSWVGFDTKWIEYENVERYAGTTKWSFFGLTHYAINAFVSFATTPLRAVIYMGTVVVLVSIVAAIYTFVQALHTPVELRNGYSTMLILILFFSGVIITILGVIGEYMARIYLELKHRPVYIAKKANFDLEEDSDKKEQ